MGLEKRVRSVRLSEEESMLFERIQEKFSPFTRTFKDTVVLCARLVWRMICTPGIFGDFIQECQRLQCTTPYTAPAKQLQLVFGEPVLPFYPRFGGTPNVARPLPDIQGPIKAVGVVLATEAYTSPSFPARFRLLFAQGITRRAA